MGFICSYLCMCIYMTDFPKFSLEELEKSKRIFKSAWYIKWVASVFILAAMSIRGVSELVWYDLVGSIIGIFLWLIVSILWKDRALIILNAVGLLFLIRNLALYYA